jgi:hypothetical protein
MPITPFLDRGSRFDPELKRVMGVAFETARIALRVADGDDSLEAIIAEKIIELAKAGENNPDLLCERVLFEFGKPGFIKECRASRTSTT